MVEVVRASPCPVHGAGGAVAAPDYLLLWRRAPIVDRHGRQGCSSVQLGPPMSCCCSSPMWRASCPWAVRCGCGRGCNAANVAGQKSPLARYLTALEARSLPPSPDFCGGRQDGILGCCTRGLVHPLVICAMEALQVVALGAWSWPVQWVGHRHWLHQCHGGWRGCRIFPIRWRRCKTARKYLLDALQNSHPVCRSSFNFLPCKTRQRSARRRPKRKIPSMFPGNISASPQCSPSNVV